MTIVSGGQTGVDRAALDFAIEHGIAHGGWCPRGRLAEDGMIAARYRLRETNSADPGERTERNVLEADATLIITRNRELFGGTLFTRQCAEKHGKPLLVICEQDQLAESVETLRKFISDHKTNSLNIAGPRQSEAPDLGEFVRKLLSASLIGD